MSAPTDLELMAFADGELSGERRDEIEAWLADDPGARGKLEALATISSMLAHGDVRARTPDVADRVMASLPAKPRTPSLRGILAGVGVVAATACLVLLAFQIEAPREPAPAGTTPATARTTAPHVEAPSLGETPKPPQGAPVREHGVEVWSVDFGSASGAVFYVPSDANGADTTTVVWVSEDEVAGGREP